MAVSFLTGFPNPTSDFGYDEEPRVKRAKFGDGYAQDMADGLNSIERTFSAEWKPLREAQKNALLAFFRSLKGSQSFLWPLPNEGVFVKVRAKKWSVMQMGTKAHWSIKATLEESFDPA